MEYGHGWLSRSKLGGLWRRKSLHFRFTYLRIDVISVERRSAQLGRASGPATGPTYIYISSYQRRLLFDLAAVLGVVRRHMARPRCLSETRGSGAASRSPTERPSEKPSDFNLDPRHDVHRLGGPDSRPSSHESRTNNASCFSSIYNMISSSHSVIRLSDPATRNDHWIWDGDAASVCTEMTASHHLHGIICMESSAYPAADVI